MIQINGRTICSNEELAELAYGDVTSGVQPLDLDDVVHDVASREASDTNNLGINAQVNYLITHLGFEQACRVIQDELKKQR